ncbi:MAG: FMN-binding protein [Clostridia bacterium]|nr:FMN-binding protein [Clostridia bacterium]
MKKILSLMLVCALLLTSAVAMADELTGKGKGFMGDIVVTVTTEDGVIKNVVVTENAETPAIAGPAIEKIPAAIVAANSADVEIVASATYTSNGIIAAVKNALDPVAFPYAEEVKKEAEVVAVSATGLKHGIAITGTPRLGPGSDANGTPVYSFNEVIAYAIVDADNRIVDLEVDILEVITTNHDESNEGDNFLAGWPGQSYANDAEGDGTVEGELLMTDEIFTTEINEWLTKRQKGDAYMMGAGSWASQMDAFEAFFIGKTVEEIDAWYAKNCSDRNGRPLKDGSSNEQDAAKYALLTDEEKATLADVTSGATMSLTDPHGDILEAVKAAVANAVAVREFDKIAKVGLGVNITPRLGPGADDQGVPCYSFNVVVAGVCYDADGKIIDMQGDVLEIITPNHDGVDDNIFTGWPGQSYNADVDADGKVDEVWTQTEEAFQDQINGYVTKRQLGDKYRMNAGTWASEMMGFENTFVGMTTDEIVEWNAKYTSDRNGRPLKDGSTNEQDAAKYALLTDEEKAALADVTSSATMSLTDPHGNILDAIVKADAGAKAVDITAE